MYRILISLFLFVYIFSYSLPVLAQEDDFSDYSYLWEDDKKKKKKRKKKDESTDVLPEAARNHGRDAN